MAEMRLSVCISQSQEIYVRLILQGEIWGMHMPIVGIITYKHLAQFPVDHLAQADVPFLILSLLYFTEIVHNMIDRFVSVTT